MTDNIELSPPDEVNECGGSLTAVPSGRGLFSEMEPPTTPTPGSPQALASEKLAGRVARLAPKGAKAKCRKHAFGETAKGLRNVSKALISKKLGLDFVEYAPTDPIWNFYLLATSIANALAYGPGHARAIDEAVAALRAVDLNLSHVGEVSDPRLLPLCALATLAEQLLNVPAEETA